MLPDIEIRPKGRPRKETLSECQKLKFKIEILKAENDLLRSFLKTFLVCFVDYSLILFHCRF